MKSKNTGIGSMQELISDRSLFRQEAVRYFSESQDASVVLQLPSRKLLLWLSSVAFVLAGLCLLLAYYPGTQTIEGVLVSGRYSTHSLPGENTTLLIPGKAVIVHIKPGQRLAASHGSQKRVLLVTALPRIISAPNLTGRDKGSASGTVDFTSIPVRLANDYSDVRDQDVPVVVAIPGGRIIDLLGWSVLGRRNQ